MNNHIVLVVAPSRKARGGITAVITTYEKTFLWKKWNCKWIETYRDSNSVIKIFYFLKGFFKYLIFLSQCKIVHIHLSWSTSAIRKFPFFFCAYILNKKTILHLHSGAETIIEGKCQYVYRFIFSHSSCIVVLADVIKDQLKKKYKFRRIEVLYNPCPVVVNNLKINKTKTILFAATLYKNKGYLDLIEAFSTIFYKLSDWKIIFAGNGEIEKGRSFAKKLGINQQVVFTGWISGEEKEKLFQEASIFCMPSHNEGFPMAILEAWAYGIPVTTTPVGGLPDVLVHGENAMVFEPGDTDTLAEHMEKLILNESLREKLSKESLKLSQGQFNIKTITQQLSVLYNHLL